MQILKEQNVKFLLKRNKVENFEQIYNMNQQICWRFICFIADL